MYTHTHTMEKVLLLIIMFSMKNAGEVKIQKKIQRKSVLNIQNIQK